MTEGTVRWHDYCPRCKKSTQKAFAFGKIRVCEACQKEEYNALSSKELYELEYNTKIGGKKK